MADQGRMASRRTFLAGLGAGLGAALLGKPTSLGAAGPPARRYLSTQGLAGGGFGLTGFDQEGESWLEIALPDRGHGCALQPGGRLAVAFARRPGTFGLVVDLEAGVVARVLDTGSGRHFYGHGCFSLDGATLFAPENDYEAGRGVVSLRDATDGFRKLGEIPSHGVGPHDLALLPDGKTLLVANGGIQTHPAKGREKLNLATMAPDLSWIDIASGNLLDKVALPPEHHRLSLRHLALSPLGHAAVAAQFEGPEEALVPLVAVRRPEGGALLPLTLPEPLATRSRNYAGGTCLDESGRMLAVSHPRGGFVAFWSLEDLSLIGTLDLADACGLAPAGGAGRILISGGRGDLVLYDATTGGSEALEGGAGLGLRWDNHMFAVV